VSSHRSLSGAQEASGDDLALAKGRGWDLGGAGVRALAVFVAVVALIAAVLAWRARPDIEPLVQASTGPEFAATSAVPTGSVVVAVSGRVRRPGLVRLSAGARVADAIEAAGGARRGASLESLNLAMPLVDGTQVLVPRAVAGGASGAVASGSASMGKVNINTATASELEALPGVGEVIAQRIVDYRTANGPFGSVDELIDVSGIGESTLASMRELVTV